MRVLLAYDGSSGATIAADLAGAIRWPTDSAIRIVTVIDPLATLLPRVGPDVPRSRDDAASSDAQERLAAAVAERVERFRGAGLAADGELRQGRPADVILDEARAFGADLLVAGSRGHGPIASLLLGSVSAELVDHATSPVLVARRTTVDRVLFATDGSEQASVAERLLTQWPIFGGSSIRVVSVADVARPWQAGIAPTMYREAMAAYAKDLETATAEHRRIADDAARRLGAAKLTVDWALRSGDAAAEILDEASSWGADLIVIGSRGQTGLARLVLGSVARNVLHAADASVLITRPAPGT